VNADEATLRMLLGEAQRERNWMQLLVKRYRDEVKGLRDELDQQRIRAEAAEAELESYRSTVTTGGPRPRVTQQWHNGASSRPSTAPAEES
jgi:hypothetical protein